jgi:hypothetical protein
MNSKYNITTGRNLGRFIGHIVFGLIDFGRVGVSNGCQHAALPSGYLCRREMAQDREVPGGRWQALGPSVLWKRQGKNGK